MTTSQIMDYKLVRLCAPTLAGRKVGSLFCMESEEYYNPLCIQLAIWNREMNPSGVFVRVVAERFGRSFIYVFREDSLKKQLKKLEIQHFLQQFDYKNFDVENCITKLSHRINSLHCFPHEIGLFLGYPLEDVKGFIENGGKNSKSIGYWKVYGDVETSEKTFRCFKKCHRVMNSLFKKGYSLKMLTVKN